MRCPHCNTVVKFYHPHPQVIEDPNNSNFEYRIINKLCPECHKLVVDLEYGHKKIIKPGEFQTKSTEWSKSLYPIGRHGVSDLVPDKYKQDFLEAASILHLSPKSSATLSRRILQQLLRDELNIKKKNNLYEEIEDFINKPDVPADISEDLHYIRIIGNLGAHPSKNNVTGEIIEVEPGEAEWLLEVIETLFNYIFIQPLKIKERRDKINQKLKEAGKPELFSNRVIKK